MPIDESQEEEAAVRAYLAGDAEAFRTLYRRYAGRVLRAVRASGLGHADAEDVVQGAFLRLHKSRETIDAARPVGPLLFTIALNLARDRLRAAGRRTGRDRRLRGESAGLESVRPDREIEERERAREMSRALDELPAAHREAVVAVRLSGLSYEEAANVFGRSEGTVRQHVHRGLRKLRELLEEPAPSNASETSPSLVEVRT